MQTLVADGCAIFEAALRSVQADRLMAGLDLAEVAGSPLRNFRRIRVIGAGKASMAMAGALEPLLAHGDVAGHVVVPHGYATTLPNMLRCPQLVEVEEAGHPVPDAAGLRAARRALETARSCGSEDLLVVLLSGGGSALWFAPLVRPEALQEVTRLLLRCGAAIDEINCIRKHCSRIKGGRLGLAARPATVITLAVSDVIGDSLAVIASGPTVRDPSTAEEAVGVAMKYGIWSQMPQEVRVALKRDLNGRPVRQSLSSLERAVLLGSNSTALRAASLEARRLGYEPQILAGALSGEARVRGAEIGRRTEASPAGTCLLWGGETTVTVRGTGRGGRNQELALAAAVALDGCGTRTLVLSGGTDGIDGPTDAAGAWATPRTLELARLQGQSAADALENNDAYGFFRSIPGLLRTGPTHTNVMDIVVALTCQSSS